MPFATLVHPTARVSPTAILGEGSIVSSGALIAADVRLGRHVFVNRGAMVGHHATIEDFCTLGPGMNIGGLGRISERVFLGIGAVVVDRISIGARPVVGAGGAVNGARCAWACRSGGSALTAPAAPPDGRASAAGGNVAPPSPG